MQIVELLLLLSCLCLLLRLSAGPTAWDRLLAYNSASNRVVVVIGVVGVATGQAVYIDVAITYAAISFLGVVILARFMERQGASR